MRAALDADVRIEAVRLATHGGAHLVYDAAGVALERADVPLGAQRVVQVHQHGDVLQGIVHHYRAYQHIFIHRSRKDALSNNSHILHYTTTAAITICTFFGLLGPGLHCCYSGSGRENVKTIVVNTG